MILLLAVPVPLLGAVAYRLRGADWRTALRSAVAGAALSVVAAAFALVAVYAFDIATRLCGERPAVTAAAGIGGYLVVGAWAAQSPRRFWAWPLALLAGAAAFELAAYFVADAHRYCET